MTELLSSFNDQMRKATGDCMQIPWQMATAQFPDILEPNVLAGIAELHRFQRMHEHSSQWASVKNGEDAAQHGARSN